MGLYTFVRQALDRERARTDEVERRKTSSSFTIDPATRVVARAFAAGLTNVADVSFDEVSQRFHALPVYSLNLLDSPAGWISLAQQMGLPPRVTVH